ncbi:MAG: hypothetical protein ACOX5J_10545 [Candidatus Hydrogenedentales bacterium]|jgi:hypothetical protein
MKRMPVALILVFLLCVIVGFAYFASRSEHPTPDVSPLSADDPIDPLSAPPPAIAPLSPELPEPAPAEESSTEPHLILEAPESLAPEQVLDNDDPFQGKPITVETLTGCKQIQEYGNAQLVIEFGENGEWKINGNARAQWTIEGGRVKIYKDGTDEIHYVDIINNKLVHNGKVLELIR